jgi:hypothetical protein
VLIAEVSCEISVIDTRTEHEEVVRNQCGVVRTER